MSLDMIQDFHEFQCRLCDIFIRLDYNASNEEKITSLKNHQNVKHFKDFEGSELSDLERMAYFIGNQLYIDGRPEAPFKRD